MEEVDILFFRNLIEDEGCIQSHLVEQDGISFQYYLSWNKTTRVPINITETLMTARTAANLLKKLELEDVIERLDLKF